MPTLDVSRGVNMEFRVECQLTFQRLDIATITSSTLCTLYLIVRRGLSHHEELPQPAMAGCTSYTLRPANWYLRTTVRPYGDLYSASLGLRDPST